MQGFCRLSRRWHQQFCHSPSFGPHQRCLQTFIPTREYRQVTRGVRRPRRDAESSLARLDSLPTVDNVDSLSPSKLLSRDHDDLVVREFEQYGSDTSTRTEIEPEKDLRDEAEEVWAEIQDIDKQLEIAKQGPFGPESEFMQQFPEEQRQEILQALAQEDTSPDSEEDALDLAEIDRMMEEEDNSTHDSDDLAVTLHIPKAHQALVGHFNQALKRAQNDDEDILKSLNLWKWYLRCRQRIPGFTQIVSENVWKYLWHSQSHLGPRKSHLVVLGRDMASVGEEMQDTQRLEFIQALKACGDSVTALSTWEDAKAQLKWSVAPEFLTDFYATGVQLYASVGRPQKAQTTAFSAIEEGADPKILVHVISGWAATNTEASSTKAWAIYLRLRSMLGDSMQPELYESISDSLLEGKHSQMALAVFKDMISRVGGSGKNTLHSYTQALGAVHADADPDDVEKAINQVSLTMLLTIPKQYQNKFFFASWIKKLLGQQKIDSASQVADLMYERNIKPDAIHLNGIIGAWLRDKSPKAREKAENLALEMVQARINHVSQLSQNTALRTFGNVFRKVMPLDEGKNTWLKPLRLDRPIPAANVETFSLLFDYNGQRHRWQEFSRLTQVMIGLAQLRPNNFIINKWLAAELRARSFSRFWTLFNGLRFEVSPDVEMFGLAWQAIAAQQTGNGGKGTFSHRQLFGEMMNHVQTMRPRRLRAAKEDFGAEFYGQIVRSFSHQLDLPGTICALKGMHDIFDATPDDNSIRLITGQVARLLPRADQTRPSMGGRRRASTKLSADQTTLKSIADIVSTLETKHKIDLVESKQATADEVEDLESTVSRKIRLDSMIEFLVIMMQRMKKSTDNPAKTLRDVAKVMHVDVESIDTESILS